MASVAQRAFNLDLLPIPSPEYSLERLLKADINPQTGKSQSEFETVVDCQEEDKGRALDLRQVARTPSPASHRPAATRLMAELDRLNINPQAASNLADRLETGAETGPPQPTLASSLFMREVRRRCLGAVLQLIDENPLEPIKTVTAIHPSWGYPADWLVDVDARQIKRQFRTHLNRAGVTNAAGFLFAWLHGEFEPVSGEFQLHFHGVAAGEKLEALNQLRNKQGYVRTPKIYRPIVINDIKNRPRQISYIMQSFWPSKARIPVEDSDCFIRVRSKHRIQEPYQSLYLSWLDKWKLSDLCELNGLRIKAGKLVRTDR